MSRVDDLMVPGAIRPFCQPVFNIHGKLPLLQSVECLSRGPAGTHFENAEILFEYARRTGIESNMDLHAASIGLKACAVLPHTLPVSLNIHASSLGASRTFGEDLLALCEWHNLHPSRLVVEITEQMPPANKEILLSNIAALRRQGALIAIDDFGAGYSNFKLLLAIQPEILKIDRELITGLHENEYQRTVTTSIVQWARNAGVQVIAEGVESAADLCAVRGLGVEYAQGFALTRPFPTSEFRSRFESRRPIRSLVPGIVPNSQTSQTLFLHEPH